MRKHGSVFPNYKKLALFDGFSTSFISNCLYFLYEQKTVTIGLISGTAIFTGIGIIFPELSLGVGSMLMGGTSLGFSLHVLKDPTKRKIDNLILDKGITIK